MKTAIIAIIAVIAVVGGYFVFYETPAVEAPNGNTSDTMPADDSDSMVDDDLIGGDADPMTADDDAMVDEGETDDASEPESFLIIFNGDAYVPSSVNVKKGDTVTWRNDSSTQTWPASASHPTHTVYPTTGGCLGSTFDACRGLAQGETFTFQFDEAGTWRFHDHLNSTIFGSVEVAE